MRRRIVTGLFALSVVAAGAVAATPPAQAVDLPTVSVGDVRVVEADAGFLLVKVPVNFSGPASVDVKVPYSFGATGDGTADDGDAVFKPKATLTFKAGAVSKVVAVKLTGDTIPEPDQNLALTVGVPTAGVTVAKAIGAVTIVDNDEASGAGAAPSADPGMLVSIGDVVMSESDAGTHTAFLPITLSEPATQPVSLSYRMGCSSAVEVQDVIVKQSGKIYFSLGQQSKSLTFKISADTTPEDLEAFVQTIKAAVGPITVDRSIGSMTIVDDDGGTPPPPPPDELAVGEIEQVSVASDGTPAQYVPVGDGGNMQISDGASVTSDGRYVAFSSDACNLVPGDANGIRDLFIRDRLTGTTERVVNSDGSEIDVEQLGILPTWPVAFWPASISDDGRYVAFTTGARLVPQDTNSHPWLGVDPRDVYVYDRVTHASELITVAPDGSATGWVHSPPSISGDGRYVTYQAQDGTPDASSLYEYVFVRDRVLGTTTKVFTVPAQQPVISTDGRFVLAVVVDPPTFVPGELWVHDLVTGTDERVDVTSDEQPADPGKWSYINFRPSISGDGRYVAFNSEAANLAPPGAQQFLRSFVRDRLLGTTTLVAPTVGQRWNGLSDDGQTLAVSGSPGEGHFFDVASGSATPFGFPYSDTAWDNLLETPRAMSGDGRFVVWKSEVPPYADVYIERIQ
jgi:Tol biopolymer transport system component